MGDGVDILGSMLTKLKVVLLELCGVERLFWGLYWPLLLACCESSRVGLSFVKFLGEFGFFFLLSVFTSDPWSTFLDFAIGNARPRSLPLLATPTPHVSVVLYPEQSLP